MDHGKTPESGAEKFSQLIWSWYAQSPLACLVDCPEKSTEAREVGTQMTPGCDELGLLRVSSPT